MIITRETIMDDDTKPITKSTNVRFMLIYSFKFPAGEMERTKETRNRENHTTLT